MYTLFGEHDNNIFMKKTFTTWEAANDACRKEMEADCGLASYWVTPEKPKASLQDNHALIESMLRLLRANYETWPFRCALSSREIKQIYDTLVILQERI